MQWPLAVRAVPGDVLAGVDRQQLQLGGVQQVVVALVEVEQRERDRREHASGDGLDRPGAIAAAVARCWNRRTGSSVDKTMTAVLSLIRCQPAWRRPSTRDMVGCPIRRVRSSPAYAMI